MVQQCMWDSVQSSLSFLASAVYIALYQSKACDCTLNSVGLEAP